MDARMCVSAASRGSLQDLKDLRSQQPPCPWDQRTCTAAARKGHLAILQHLRSCNPPCPWTAEVCTAAAAAGHLELLQWAISQQCDWNEEAFEQAWENRQWPIVDWLRAQNASLCPLDTHKAAYAARQGDIERLAWLKQEGLHFAPAHITAALNSRQYTAFDWLSEHATVDGMQSEEQAPAAKISVHDLAQEASSGRFSDASKRSARAGCQVLVRVLEQLPLDDLCTKEVADAVATAGHVSAMQWLVEHQNSPAWGASTCAAAALAGHIPMLQLLRSQGSLPLSGPDSTVRQLCTPKVGWYWNACWLEGNCLGTHQGLIALTG
ncbi:hypothetical protein WJX74_008729 [Apatococcus lobatus]|uniref:Ankyrin repeat domain-containing protein n=1 Tax=Apatococcus lobatus TaxID=904363 RepID=A0AAW1QJA3_9CHLO